MPGLLKGLGKCWNIDTIWGYILLILATNCNFQYGQTFLTPPSLRKTFWSPPLPGTENFFGPLHFAQPPPHQSIYEHSLRIVLRHYAPINAQVAVYHTILQSHDNVILPERLTTMYSDYILWVNITLMASIEKGQIYAVTFCTLFGYYIL